MVTKNRHIHPTAPEKAHNNLAGKAPSFESLIETVRACVPRLTKGKKAVLSVLFDSEMPLTAHEISHRIESEPCFGAEQDSVDLATVYRNIEQFVKLGIISKTEHSQGGWRYALAQKSHSHSITCVQCGKELSLGACVLTDVEKIIAERTGFTHLRHVVTFTGSCPACTNE